MFIVVRFYMVSYLSHRLIRSSVGNMMGCGRGLVLELLNWYNI